MMAKLEEDIGLDKSDDEDVEALVENLDRLGLVNWEVGKSAAEITLEPDGFDVAHERELAKRQDRMNTNLVGLTAALVLSSLVTVLP